LWWVGDEKARSADPADGRHPEEIRAAFIKDLLKTGGATLFAENTKTQYARVEH
jgi:hypothetical protein